MSPFAGSVWLRFGEAPETKPCDARRAARLGRSGRRLTETRVTAGACSPKHSCVVLSRHGRCLMLSMQQSTKSAGYGNVGGRFRVLPLTLDTGEILPTLVDSVSWIPVRVATRWVVRRRRWRSMPSTLTNDLRSLALLYT